jgi:hypothetical protein
MTLSESMPKVSQKATRGNCMLGLILKGSVDG